MEKQERGVIEKGADPKDGCKMQCEITGGMEEPGDQRASAGCYVTAWSGQQPKLPFDLHPSSYY